VSGANGALAENVASCAATNAICTSVSATECTISDIRALTIPAGGTFSCAVDRDLVSPVPAAWSSRVTAMPSAR